MAWFIFLTANLIVGLTAFFLTRPLQLSLNERILAIFTISTAQIVATMLLAGTIFNLNIPVLLSINLILLACAYVYSSLQNPPCLKARPPVQTGVLWLRSSWAVILFFLVVFQVAWIVFLGVLFPPYAWDSLYYHLAAAAGWLKDGRIIQSPYPVWAGVYPMNTELVFTWIMLFFKSDTVVDLTQLVFAKAGSFSVYALGRQIGLKQDNSVAAACLFFLTPVILVQSKTCYVDVAFAGMFLTAYYFTLRYYYSRRMTYLVLSGLAGGLLLGMKASAVLYIAVNFLLIVLGLLRENIKKNLPSGSNCFFLRESSPACFSFGEAFGTYETG